MIRSLTRKVLGSAAAAFDCEGATIVVPTAGGWAVRVWTVRVTHRPMTARMPITATTPTMIRVIHSPRLFRRAGAREAGREVTSGL